MEAQEINYLQKHYSRNQDFVFFEVGAYDFSDSIQVRSLFPNAKIFSLEAFRENIDKYANRAYQHRIHWDWMAASDHTGTIYFYPSISYGKYGAWTGSGSIILPEVIENTDISPIYQDLKFDLNGKETPCTTIDDYCETRDIPKIDWFHIDAQGAEYKIISAIEKILPTFIWAEICEFSTYKTGVTIADFDAMLENKGYQKIENFGSDAMYQKLN
jgi:FkbM family methyltransferase